MSASILVRRAGLIPLVVWAALAGCSAAAAKDLDWPGIIGKDDRVIADSTKEPWRAVGRFNYAGYRDQVSCSGTLISPTAVATAAHCFFHRRSNEPLPVGNFRFVLGLNRDKYLAVAGIKCVHFNSDFDPKRKRSVQFSYADSAIAILDKPVKEAPLELAEDGALAPGGRVLHGGYGRDRRYMLSVHDNCKILKVDGNVVLTDCDTNFGQSGGPVLLEENGKFKLAAVMSGYVEKRATAVSAVKVWRNMVSDESCAQQN